MDVVAEDCGLGLGTKDEYSAMEVPVEFVITRPEGTRQRRISHSRSRDLITRYLSAELCEGRERNTHVTRELCSHNRRLPPLPAPRANHGLYSLCAIKQYVPPITRQEDICST
jgi:hypothetical protein